MTSPFGRSLKLYQGPQVCAGGDGSDAADLNVIGTVVFDMGRFGYQFVGLDPATPDGTWSRAGHRSMGSRCQGLQDTPLPSW